MDIRRHIRFSPLHTILFAAALIAANGFAPRADGRADSRSERAHRSATRRLRGSSTRSALIDWIVEIIVLIVVFAAVIALGVLIPGWAAMKLLHDGGWIEQRPDAPWLLWAALRYTLIAAAAMVLGGRLLRLRRHGYFVGSYIAMLFMYAFLMPLLLSSLLIIPVHLIASPVYGIDAWREWRPLLHAALAGAGAILALWMHFAARRSLRDPVTAAG